MRIQRQFYGWHDPRKGYMVSREPPDSPVRPSIEFESTTDAIATIKKRYRAEILWIPALPKEALRDADQYHVALT